MKEGQHVLSFESENSEISQFEQTMELICLEMAKVRAIEDLSVCAPKRDQI